MKRKVLALLMAIVTGSALFAGGRTDSGSAQQSGGQRKLVFEYFATSFAVEWIQQIGDLLKEEGKKYNFEVLTADANRSIETQLSQIDAAIVQKIDGAFIMVVDEGHAPAVVSKFNEGGIPVIGESMKLQDGNGNVIAPYVELFAEDVGAKCGKWVSDNWKSTGVDLSNMATVGVINNTNSRYRTDFNRVSGFMDALKTGFPNLRDSNVFVADCAAETGSRDNTEASYKQVSAVLSAHPEITAWVVFGSGDMYAQGAVRAIEASGVENKTILVSSGGEQAVKEWANNAAPSWRAACYYSPQDWVDRLVAGMLEICREGKTGADIFPEFKKPGQNYSVIQISGNMVTPVNYKEFVR
jgi:ABC-type sugar transport system substrate-binding protein